MENKTQATTHLEGIPRCRNVILFLYNQSIINGEFRVLAWQATLLPGVFSRHWQYSPHPLILLLFPDFEIC